LKRTVSARWSPDREQLGRSPTTRGEWPCHDGREGITLTRSQKHRKGHAVAMLSTSECRCAVRASISQMLRREPAGRSVSTPEWACSDVPLSSDLITAPSSFLWFFRFPRMHRSLLTAPSSPRTSVSKLRANFLYFSAGETASRIRNRTRCYPWERGARDRARRYVQSSPECRRSRSPGANVNARPCCAIQPGRGRSPRPPFDRRRQGCFSAPGVEFHPGGLGCTANARKCFSESDFDSYDAFRSEAGTAASETIRVTALRRMSRHCVRAKRADRTIAAYRRRRDGQLSSRPVTRPCCVSQ
jgi:hypothetical protein